VTTDSLWVFDASECAVASNSSAHQSVGQGSLLTSERCAKTLFEARRSACRGGVPSHAQFCPSEESVLLFQDLVLSQPTTEHVQVNAEIKLDQVAKRGSLQPDALPAQRKRELPSDRLKRRTSNQAPAARHQQPSPSGQAPATKPQRLGTSNQAPAAWHQQPSPSGLVRPAGPSRQVAAGVEVGVTAFGGWVPSDLRRFLPLAVFLTCLAEMVLLPTRFFFDSAIAIPLSKGDEHTCGTNALFNPPIVSTNVTAQGSVATFLRATANNSEVQPAPT
jgi:hypothetical protein